jgi:hypothetical protein
MIACVVSFKNSESPFARLSQDLLKHLSEGIQEKQREYLKGKGRTTPDPTPIAENPPNLIRQVHLRTNPNLQIPTAQRFLLLDPAAPP